MLLGLGRRKAIKYWVCAIYSSSLFFFESAAASLLQGFSARNWRWGCKAGVKVLYNYKQASSELGQRHFRVLKLPASNRALYFNQVIDWAEHLSVLRAVRRRLTLELHQPSMRAAVLSISYAERVIEVIRVYDGRYKSLSGAGGFISKLGR